MKSLIKTLGLVLVCSFLAFGPTNSIANDWSDIDHETETSDDYAQNDAHDDYETGEYEAHQRKEEYKDIPMASPVDSDDEDDDQYASNDYEDFNDYDDPSYVSETDYEDYETEYN